MCNHTRRCTPLCSSGMRNQHRVPAAACTLHSPALHLRPATTPRWSGTAAAGGAGRTGPAFSPQPYAQLPTLRKLYLFCGAAQMPGRPPYYTAPCRFCKGAGASVPPAHARMLWVSRQATGSRSSASVRMELISIAPLPARSVNSGVPPSRA